MTIYDFTKNPLSPFLIRMIVLMYRDKLEKLSNFNLSNLLRYLGISNIGDDNKSARVNSSIYDSYNRNQFFNGLFVITSTHLGCCMIIHEYTLRNFLILRNIGPQPHT